MKKTIYLLISCFIFISSSSFSQSVAPTSPQIIEPVETGLEISKPTPIENLVLPEERFFPSKPDLEYKYQSNIGTAKGTFTVHDDSFSCRVKNSKFIYEQSLAVTEEGLFQTESINRVLRFFGRDHEYPDPIPVLLYPITVGQKWDWEGIQIAKDDTTHIFVNGEIKTKELIQTAAGMFECYQVYLKFLSEKGSSYEITQWLAPDIGMVKAEIKMNGKGLGKLLQKFAGLESVHFELIEIKGLNINEESGLPKHVVCNEND